jgi:hypothetical protein
MFKSFLEQSIDSVVLKARTSEHVVQQKYIDIYKIIEDHVKEHKLIVSNVETLLNKNKTNSSSYIIYGTNIFKHANAICNAIAVVNIYVSLSTNVKNEDFEIFVDGAPMIQLWNVQPKLITTISPILINDMLLYPPEFELMSIYHKLYVPNYASEWSKLKELSLIIYDQFKDRQLIIGGKHKKQKFKNSSNFKNSSSFKNSSNFKAKENYSKAQSGISNIIILNWLKGRKDYMLVGKNAINILNNTYTEHRQDSKYEQKIQIIVSSNINNFITEFKNLIKQLTGYDPYSKTYNLNLLIEPRLEKVLVSVVINTRTIHLLEIFNAAAYELVPYSIYKDFNIAYKNVIRMYQLIDLWFFRLLAAMNLIKSSYLKTLVENIFKTFDSIDDIPDDIYELELFMGINVELKRFKQKNKISSGIYPYYPENYRYNHGGKYREIN